MSEMEHTKRLIFISSVITYLLISNNILNYEIMMQILRVQWSPKNQSHAMPAAN